MCDFVGEVHRDEEFESGQRSDEYAFNMRFAENRSWDGGVTDDWEHVRFARQCALVACGVQSACKLGKFALFRAASACVPAYSSSA